MQCQHDIAGAREGKFSPPKFFVRTSDNTISTLMDKKLRECHAFTKVLCHSRSFLKQPHGHSGHFLRKLQPWHLPRHPRLPCCPKRRKRSAPRRKCCIR